MKDSGKHFYNVLEEIDHGADNWMITVLSGSHSGEKALISSGELKWTSDDDGFTPANAEKLIKVTECGITEVCGTEVYAELLSSEKQIVVCGAGHISIPIITIGKMTGFRVVVIDDRLHFVNNAIDAGADEVIFREFGEALDGIPGGKNTFFVIVTRPVQEALVNAFAHRDYLELGSEVHVDMYDDRLEIYSPGGMLDGTRVQDQDIRHIPSRRRNPLLADLFEKLGYMERQGSGLKNICDETEAAANYK